MRVSRPFCRIVILLAALLPPLGASSDERREAPQLVLGERLFLEERFAANEQMPALSCGSCHMSPKAAILISGEARAYTDFFARSPLPPRDDGRSLTLRNTPALVDISQERRTQRRFHFDGEFTTLTDLVRETLTGRAFGFLPEEKDLATSRLASVVRGDDGTDPLARRFGSLPYPVLFRRALSSAPGSPLAAIESLSDAEVIGAVSRMIAAYVRSLRFSRGEAGEFNGAPYDLFLKRNGLPARPAQGENDLQYSKRLRRMLLQLNPAIFIEPGERAFQLHQQEFIFGPNEMRGLLIFLERAGDLSKSPDLLRRGGVGNCASCHPAPRFTDFGFHNTAVAEEEYDAVHGRGSFTAVYIPGFRERRRDPEKYLPRSAKHPHARGPFAAIPFLQNPGHTDLGLWNVMLNHDSPRSRRALQRELCKSTRCSRAKLLRRSIASFKTQGLRNLGHSGPYLHNGSKHTVAEVLLFYRTAAEKSRTRGVRNGSALLKGIALTDRDLRDLELFMHALNEDFSA